jgi:hypothetical protein
MEAKLNHMVGPKDDLPHVPYAKLVCALLFIARCTRFDILSSITFLCTYLTNYTSAHSEAAIRVLTYLKCTMDFTLTYTLVLSDVCPVEICIDSYWLGNKKLFDPQQDVSFTLRRSGIMLLSKTTL